MAVKFLDYTGLGYFWSKIKVWCNATFAAITHNHASNAVNAMTGYNKPNSSSAIAASDSLNSAIGKLEYKVDSYDDSNYVHKTGDEDVAGKKFFQNIYRDRPVADPDGEYTSSVFLRTPTFDKGDTTRTAYEFANFVILDRTGSGLDWDGRLATLEYNTPVTVGAHGQLKLSVYKNEHPAVVNGNNIVSLYVGFDGNDVPFAQAPPTSALRNVGNDIVTRNWIPNDTRIVHTSGDEVISGMKYFNSGIFIKHTTVTKGTNPSGYSYRQVNFIENTEDTNTASRVGCVENFVATDGSTETSIRAYNYVANSTTYERIAIVYPKNGTPYTFAPTPSDVIDNSTKIATTAWAFPRISRFYDYVTSATLDLNNFITPGVYTFSGYTDEDTGTVYKVANIPEGVNGVLLVIGNSNYVIRQMWFRLGINNSTDHRIFVRQRNWLQSNSWSTWTRLFTSKDTIPVVNGGTGQTSVANIQAGKDGNGNTISSTYLPLSGGTMTGLIARNGELARSGVTNGTISFYSGTSASHGAGIWLYGKDHSSRPGWANLQTSDGTNYYGFIIEPVNKYARFTSTITEVRCDNKATLGSQNVRWGVLYTTGNVNVGSDERIKQQISAIPDEILNAWENTDWCQFKLNEEVEKNGNDKANLHTGLIAQRVSEVLTSVGINPLKYGFIDYASWDAVPEQLDEEGNVIVSASSAGDEYSICYVEALCIEAAYQRRKNKILENRISELENQLSFVLQTLKELKGVG